MAEAQIARDPHIGFGKPNAQNLPPLTGTPALAARGRPVLIGASRKSFLGRLTGREVNDRLAGSLAAATFAAMQGAHILRVHDVKESCDAIGLVDKLRAQGTHE